MRNKSSSFDTNPPLSPNPHFFIMNIEKAQTPNPVSTKNYNHDIYKHTHNHNYKSDVYQQIYIYIRLKPQTHKFVNNK